MKKILPLLFIAFTFLSTNANAQQRHTSKIKVTAEKIGWHNARNYQDTMQCLEVKVTLENMIADTQEFINYSCSYYECFTAAGGAQIYPWGCDKNTSLPLSLTPHGTSGSTVTYKIDIIPSKKDRKAFSIGFKWFKIRRSSLPKGNPDRLKENEKMLSISQRSADEVIWSNEVSFK